MSISKWRARRWAVAASVAAALGFGAAGALARPAEPAAGAVCGEYSCEQSCKRRGYVSGDCVNGACVCWQT